MKKTIASLLLTCGLAVPLMFAQNPGNPGNPPNPQGPPSAEKFIERRLHRLTVILDLTAAQQQQATTIFTNAATNVGTIMTNLRTARETLRTAAQNNDTNTINQTATTIGTLTGQLIAARTLAEAAFFQILTADQKTKLEQLGGMHAFGGGFKGRGMGPGMMGPGVGPGPNHFRGGRR